MSFEEMNALSTKGAETFTFSDANAERILFPVANIFGNHAYSSVEVKTKLIQLKKKVTHLKLHGYTLSEYWRNKCTPQGLHIQEAPSTGKQNEDFNKWCEILNKCSMDLMLSIIEEVSRQKEDALKDIANHEALMREKLGNDFNHVIDSIK